MYETRVTYAIKGKTESIVIATESHPHDITNNTWQSLVYDQLISIPEGITVKSILIKSTELLGGSSQGAISTEQDLDNAVEALTEAEVRQIVKQIATLWFVEEDGSLNLNKELGSDHLEAVTQALTSRGIMPTN